VTQPETEHPHDTEDLVRLVSIVRQEQSWTQAQLAEAAGVRESDVARFEAEQIVPAKPLAIRFLEAMGKVEPGLFYRASTWVAVNLNPAARRTSLSNAAAAAPVGSPRRTEPA
jgi:DNA-binding XRE family transcriptional regulator